MPFVRIAGYFEAMQLNAPRIVEADPGSGFLLLSDLGTREYLDALRADPSSVGGLYGDAIDALLTLQRRGAAFQGLLPSYDNESLRFEMSLFPEWLCGIHLGIRFGDEEKRDWQRCCDRLVANAFDQPQVFVHRDYHSRNLMVTAADNPGILDFQDAVEGPLTYDLVSLLKDAYIKWPVAEVWQWALDFYRGMDAGIRERISEEQFRCYFELMGVQRHLKVAGIFARLHHRDGKAGFLADIPRTLSYIVDVAPCYGELGFLADLIETRILPGLDDSG